jgi:hypothetical protein
MSTSGFVSAAGFAAQATSAVLKRESAMSANNKARNGAARLGMEGSSSVDTQGGLCGQGRLLSL